MLRGNSSALQALRVPLSRPAKRTNATPPRWQEPPLCSCFDGPIALALVHGARPCRILAGPAGRNLASPAEGEADQSTDHRPQRRDGYQREGRGVPAAADEGGGLLRGATTFGRLRSVRVVGSAVHYLHIILRGVVVRVLAGRREILIRELRHGRVRVLCYGLLGDGRGLGFGHRCRGGVVAGRRNRRRREGDAGWRARRIIRPERVEPADGGEPLLRVEHLLHPDRALAIDTAALAVGSARGVHHHAVVVLRDQVRVELDPRRHVLVHARVGVFGEDHDRFPDRTLDDLGRMLRTRILPNVVGALVSLVHDLLDRLFHAALPSAHAILDALAGVPDLLLYKNVHEPGPVAHHGEAPVEDLRVVAEEVPRRHRLRDLPRDDVDRHVGSGVGRVLSDPGHGQEVGLRGAGHGDLRVGSAEHGDGPREGSVRHILLRQGRIRAVVAHVEAIRIAPRSSGESEAQVEGGAVEEVAIDVEDIGHGQLVRHGHGERLALPEVVRAGLVQVPPLLGQRGIHDREHAPDAKRGVVRQVRVANGGRLPLAERLQEVEHAVAPFRRQAGAVRHLAHVGTRAEDVRDVALRVVEEDVVPRRGGKAAHGLVRDLPDDEHVRHHGHVSLGHPLGRPHCRPRGVVRDDVEDPGLVLVRDRQGLSVLEHGDVRAVVAVALGQQTHELDGAAGTSAALHRDARQRRDVQQRSLAVGAGPGRGAQHGAAGRKTGSPWAPPADPPTRPLPESDCRCPPARRPQLPAAGDRWSCTRPTPPTATHATAPGWCPGSRASRSPPGQTPAWGTASGSGRSCAALRARSSWLAAPKPGESRSPGSRPSAWTPPRHPPWRPEPPTGPYRPPSSLAGRKAPRPSRPWRPKLPEAGDTRASWPVFQLAAWLSNSCGVRRLWPLHSAVGARSAAVKGRERRALATHKMRLRWSSSAIRDGGYSPVAQLGGYRHRGSVEGVTGLQLLRRENEEEGIREKIQRSEKIAARSVARGRRALAGRIATKSRAEPCLPRSVVRPSPGTASHHLSTSLTPSSLSWQRSTVRGAPDAVRFQEAKRSANPRGVPRDGGSDRGKGRSSWPSRIRGFSQRSVDYFAFPRRTAEGRAAQGRAPPRSRGLPHGPSGCRGPLRSCGLGGGRRTFAKFELEADEALSPPIGNNGGRDAAAARAGGPRGRARSGGLSREDPQPGLQRACQLRDGLQHRRAARRGGAGPAAHDAERRRGAGPPRRSRARRPRVHHDHGHGGGAHAGDLGAGQDAGPPHHRHHLEREHEPPPHGEHAVAVRARRGRPGAGRQLAKAPVTRPGHPDAIQVCAGAEQGRGVPDGGSDDHGQEGEGGRRPRDVLPRGPACQGPHHPHARPGDPVQGPLAGVPGGPAAEGGDQPGPVLRELGAESRGAREEGAAHRAAGPHGRAGPGPDDAGAGPAPVGYDLPHEDAGRQAARRAVAPARPHHLRRGHRPLQGEVLPVQDRGLHRPGGPPYPHADRARDAAVRAPVPHRQGSRRARPEERGGGRAAAWQRRRPRAAVPGPPELRRPARGQQLDPRHHESAEEAPHGGRDAGGRVRRRHGRRHRHGAGRHQHVRPHEVLACRDERVPHHHGGQPAAAQSRGVQPL
eukprot:scaffold1282_cov251-Pinguiococcus_pyrenoidosus.AAC.11